MSTGVKKTEKRWHRRSSNSGAIALPRFLHIPFHPLCGASLALDAKEEITTHRRRRTREGSRPQREGPGT